MKKISILILLVLVLAFLVSPASAIIGGEEDYKHTNVGAIVLKWPLHDYAVARLCTATLIHPRVLLSAGHCFTMLEAGNNRDEPLYITFEQDALFGDPEKDKEYLVVAGYVYPEDIYTDTDDFKDIALVLLEKAVPKDWGIKTQDLPKPGYMDAVVGEIKGQQEIKFTIVGYGAQDFYTIYADRFLEAVRKSGTATYKSLLPHQLETYQNWEDGQTCHGDSGGPIFHENDDGEEEIVGLLGGGTGGDAWGCKADFSHYRVDTESAQEWIREAMKILLKDQ